MRADIAAKQDDQKPAASAFRSVISPFGPCSFNGKPQATANLARRRLRLAVKRRGCFESVAKDESGADCHTALPGNSRAPIQGTASRSACLLPRSGGLSPGTSL